MKKEGSVLELPEYLKRAKSSILLIEGDEGRIHDLNRSAKNSFGPSSKRLRNASFDEIFSSGKGWKQTRELVLEHGYYRTGPLSIEGSEQKAYLTVHPLYIEGEELFFAGYIEESHEGNGKGSKEELEEETASNYLEYLDEIMYRFGYGADGSLEPIYVSPRIGELFGFGSSDHIERFRNGDIEERIHPEDLSRYQEFQRMAGERKEPVSLIYRIHPEGRTDQRWIEEKIYPLFGEHEEQVGIMGILQDVTEHKVAERRLLQREKHFRNLFENNLAGVFRTTPDRTVLSCNEAFVKMLGYQGKEELIGHTVESIYHSSTDKGKFVDLVRENEGLTGHESRVTLKDERVKYFIENVTPIRNEDGELVYIDGTMIDITELKEANMALQESEERYRTLVDAAVDAILVWEWESGRIVNVNRSALNLLKREEEEVLHRELEGFFPEGKKDPLEEISSRSGEDPDPSLLNEDSALIDKEGERIPVEVNARAFELKGKRYVIGLFRDISKWIESQRALQDSEERFRLLSEATIEGIVLSKNGIIKDLNEQFAKIFGYGPRKELIGCELTQLIHPDYRDIGRKRMKGEAGSDFVEAKALKKDGTDIDVLAKGKFIPYHGEEVRVTVVQDITQRKRVEEELRERERAMYTLLGNLPGIAYRCYNDPDWTMQFLSQGCEDMLGIRPEQLIDNREYSFGSLIHEDDMDRVWDTVQEAISNGERFDVQYRLYTADGSLLTVWERGEAIGVDADNGREIIEGFVTDISKRVEYEEELERSQTRYRDLIENAPYGTILHKDGEVLYVNRRAKKLFGIGNLEDIPSKKLLDYLDPEFHEQFRDRMERIQKGEQLPFVEIRGTAPGREEKLELEAKTDLIEYKGEMVFHSAFRDISGEKQLERQRMRTEVAEEYNKQLEKEIEEHKRTQQKLRDSQDFTRSIIESSLDMIIASDPEGRINVFNKAAEERFGYSREEIMGSYSDELILYEEERKKVLNDIHEKGGFSGEITNVDKEGRAFTTYLSATQLEDHNGEVIGSMGISRDITDIKKAEEELRKSEEKYRAIYDQAYIGIAQVDLEGNFLNTNQQLCSIIGYTEAELQGMNFQDLTVDNDQERSESFKEELKEQKKERVSFEKQYLHKNGSRIDLNLTVALVRDRKDEPAYFVTVFEDITERKKNEEELIRSLKEKEVLLREVHHRVKNNLQVISSILNLQSNFVEDRNTLQILQESQNRISSMSFIHESLYRTDEFDSIDLANYVKELSSNLIHSYYSRDQEVRIEHDLENVELDLDQAIPCGLIINELVSNALKYAFEGRKEGKVLIEVRQVEQEEKEASEVRIRIADDGVGLPEGYEVGESDSLGLQLVSSLLQQIEGEIRLKRGNGTEYLITFDKR